MQILLKDDPLPDDETYNWSTNLWGCNWIEDPGWDRASSHVCAFRKTFTLKKQTKIRFHVSADQRYTLFMDGGRLGFGPERGNDDNWFFQTHALTLPPGRHRLVARVWWASLADGLAHLGHCGHAPALLVRGEAEMDAVLSTGRNRWEVQTICGVTFSPAVGADGFCCVGARTNIDAARHPRGVEKGAGAASDWVEAHVAEPAFLRSHLRNDFMARRQLTHGTLPPMFEKTRRPGTVRHAQPLSSAASIDAVPFTSAEHDAALAGAVQKLLDADKPVTIPARSRIRLLVDIGDYVCAWPTLTVSKGAGARLTLAWAESLYEQPRNNHKGSRNETEGKFFRGLADSLRCDGSSRFVFEPLWWEAGRYIRLDIQTKKEPLRINAFTLRETHYPHRFTSSFTCDDTRWNHLLKISRRALEMCSHEVYFDCPYYEQLMYAGDTRLEVLTTYAATADDRLPRKAITLFDASRDTSGLTRSRTPSAVDQIIPPFSMWWAMMVHDHAFWQNDLDFVRQRMPGVRAVIEAFRARVGDDGLLRPLPGWNFTDWVPDWPGGIPPVGQDDVNATLNLQFAWVLRAVAELEDHFGEPELASRNRRMAAQISDAAVQTFWVPERGLFAENRDKTRFAEHAQCMAVLGGSVPDGADITPALLTAPDLDRATIYFSHYLFETFRVLRKPEAIHDRLGLWFEHQALGLKTTVEMPEPTRSDCHAWGAHPMFHAYATFAGIRPAAPGFSRIAITPLPGPLRELKAKMIHPCGEAIRVAIHQGPDGSLHGSASVPEGIPATLMLEPGTPAQSWTGGTHTF